MQLIIFFSLILAVASASAGTATCPPEAAAVLSESRQLILVQAAGWNTQQTRMTWWQRGAASEPWRLKKSEGPAVIGKAGLAWGHAYARLESPWRTRNQPVKHEGDGRTPAGVHRLGKKFGFASQPGDFLLLTAGTACVDDPESRHYNRIVDGSVTARDWRSAEMMREIPGYKLGFLIDYLSNAVERAGSCIFVHIWSGPGRGTAGCLAAGEDRIAELQAWIESDAHPAIAFLTDDDTRGAWAGCFKFSK